MPLSCVNSPVEWGPSLNLSRPKSIIYPLEQLETLGDALLDFSAMNNLEQWFQGVS
ncbi:DUF4351 domain-containing protein [Candidatus Synechococcus calcipolaris G9]|uniref:DUF4351 domain-containing protein n=1 Tax=Candidatus Synechococcus calcipolaris G9 TaxID=1497997 RepID=A0ABT6EWG1_9SYNE|nr:DUF4351 domain-containing protein [Candidatus Synechococcus calcipolaris]MDG2989839.1 DUF4351 domain-containing protein [Candidatus Synechococcus calcipolaris G9]